MKNPLRFCQCFSAAAAACLLLCTSINLAAAVEPKLYEISTKDLCTQMFDDIKERENEMIFPRGSSLPGQTHGKTSDTKQSKGLNVILLFDVSRSVVNKAAESGMPMSKIKKEVVKLIDSLSPSTRFNVVQFTRNYMPFKEGLVPADAASRRDFQEWVGKKWNNAGTLSSDNEGAVKNPDGVLGVLKFSKKMNPDAIYLISDGSFEKGPLERRDKVDWSDVRKLLSSMSANGKRVPINFIAFAPKQSDALEMKNIAGESGGIFRVMTKQKS